MIALVAALAVACALAGVGWGLAFGWRNSRDVALGRFPAGPKPPREPNASALDFRAFGKREREAAP